jgi:hypothetical protein
MSSDEYGSVVDVSTTNLGTAFVADAAIGATTLFLVDVSIFDENGGTVSVSSDTLRTEYAYTAIDTTLNTMTLLAGLLYAASAAADRAEVWPLASVRTAMVQFGIEEGEAVRVTIPHYFSGLPDGARAAGEEEVVLVQERLTGELYLKDVMAKGMSVLGPGANLDDYVYQGVFVQPHSTDALLSLNYPPQTAAGAYAGFLEVLSAPTGYMVTQRYTAHRNSTRAPYPSTWTRVFGLGAWSGWEAVLDDVADISSVASICVNQSGWAVTSGHLRQVGKLVSVHLFMTYLGTGITVPVTGNIANSPVCQMVAAYRPGIGYSQGGLGTLSTGRAACFHVETDGTIVINSVGGTANIAPNETFSAGGTYLLQ